jgi:hypothetical protein
MSVSFVDLSSYHELCHGSFFFEGNYSEGDPYCAALLLKTKEKQELYKVPKWRTKMTRKERATLWQGSQPALEAKATILAEPIHLTI